MTKKVTDIANARKKRQKEAESRPCSFTAISDEGNEVHGMAAFAVVAKRNGGVDKMFETAIANGVAHAMNELMNTGHNKKKS